MVDASNREEAQRCLHIARSALAASDFAKAQRFAEKASRLSSSLSSEVGVLQKEIERKQSSGEATTSSGAGRSTRSSSGANGAAPAGMSGAGLHSRGGARGGEGGAATAPEPPKGTPEQRQLVRKIIATKDYYEMLSVTRSAGEDELKRGYKKLALKLHPDKNQAPGAVEAFKAVSRAYACLSDGDKRANYDRYGHEDPSQLGRRGGGNGGGGGRGMYAQDQFDPDEIFNMFFGGGFGGGGFGPRTRVYTNFGGGNPFQQRRQAGAQPAQAASPYAQLMHFVPILILLAFTFLSTQSEPAVSLDKRGDYKEPYNTQRYNVPYFAKSGDNFQRSYPPGSSSRLRLEQNIEVEYKDRLEHACQRERVAQLRASRFGNREKARSMKLPHCDEIFERFGYRYGYAY